MKQSNTKQSNYQTINYFLSHDLGAPISGYSPLSPWVNQDLVLKLNLFATNQACIFFKQSLVSFSSSKREEQNIKKFVSSAKNLRNYLSPTAPDISFM